VQLATLMATTERMVFGTCIANIWARPAQTTHAAAAQLAQAYPGRFVVGLGVGYPEQAATTGQEFGTPLVTMRDYVDRMDSPTWPPAPDAAYPRIVAANGPKMLALAGEIADGAMPAGLASGVHRTSPAGARRQAPCRRTVRGQRRRRRPGESDCAGRGIGQAQRAIVCGPDGRAGLLGPGHRRSERPDRACACR
jgi:alkanesulfonate monooxygenase SsuD/methylene tetrahydromethanopterin reductase-like flavin-dependent oxidoreductase (luciferase family)